MTMDTRNKKLRNKNKNRSKIALDNRRTYNDECVRSTKTYKRKKKNRESCRKTSTLGQRIGELEIKQTIVHAEMVVISDCWGRQAVVRLSSRVWSHSFFTFATFHRSLALLFACILLVEGLKKPAPRSPNKASEEGEKQ